MKKSLLFILCICFILAVGCTKSINQEVPSLASSYVNIESQLSSGVKSSEINSGSESTISNVNPSVIELLNNCGHVQSLIDIKMNSFIPNYTGFSDLYSLSPLKEYKSKQSFSTISTQEGGTFYLYFVYDDDIKLNCQTHFFLHEWFYFDQ